MKEVLNLTSVAIPMCYYHCVLFYSMTDDPNSMKSIEKQYSISLA